MENWIVIFTAVYPQEVYLAQSLLESEEVPTFMKDELTAQVNNFYSTAIGGVKLMVPSSEAERAVEILVKGGYIRPGEMPDASGNSPDSTRKTVAPVASDVETVRTADHDHCPYCGSENISKTKEASSIAVFLCYLIGPLLPVFKRTWRCWNCDREWKFDRK